MLNTSTSINSKNTKKKNINAAIKVHSQPKKPKFTVQLIKLNFEVNHRLHNNNNLVIRIYVMEKLVRITYE